MQRHEACSPGNGASGRDGTLTACACARARLPSTRSGFIFKKTGRCFVIYKENLHNAARIRPKYPLCHFLTFLPNESPRQVTEQALPGDCTRTGSAAPEPRCCSPKCAGFPHGRCGRRPGSRPRRGSAGRGSTGPWAGRPYRRGRGSGQSALSAASPWRPGSGPVGGVVESPQPNAMRP